MIQWNLANVALGVRVTAFATAVSVAGCIDVGHPAEIGCLVDMTEPGCMPASADASTIDAARDSAIRLDAPQSDGATEAESATSNEGDADAGVLPISDAASDGSSDASGDAAMTDADRDGSLGD